MSKTDDFIWKAIQTACWLIFAGLCIQTGTLIFNYIYSLFKPVATHNLHLGLDLSKIHEQSFLIYNARFSLILILSFLKATVFYYVIRLFTKMEISKPFSISISTLITTISYYSFSVGLISYLAHQFVKQISHKGYDVNAISRYWDDSGAYLMMSAILFVIAMIFKKGIELQNENELTV
jgi:hypothetical protein